VPLAWPFLGVTLVYRVFLVRELELGGPGKACWGTKICDAAYLQRLNRGAILTKIPSGT
jgi:hypothetical protein